MTFDTFGIQVGPLTVRYYALLISAGVLAGTAVAAWDVRRRGQDSDFVWDLLVWAVVGGVAGARLWWILLRSPSGMAAGLTTSHFLSHPWEALAVWRGGISVIGGVPGGLLGVYLYLRRHRRRFVPFTDSIAPALPLGQAIGRWGNVVNDELHGLPTDLPWGLPAARPIAPFPPGQRFHPVFLYESVGTLLIGLALIVLARRGARRLRAGDLFLLYLVSYGLLRALLDCFKPDLPQVFGVNGTQAFMVLVAAAAALVLARRHAVGRRPFASPGAGTPHLPGGPPL